MDPAAGHSAFLLSQILFHKQNPFKSKIVPTARFILYLRKSVQAPPVTKINAKFLQICTRILYKSVKAVIRYAAKAAAVKKRTIMKNTYKNLEIRFNNNSLFILNPHKNKSGGEYMRKYEYSGTEYSVNSKYSIEHALNELLEEIILDRYRKKHGKTRGL